MLDEFFPRGVIHYLLGGLLIGSGISVLFLLTGLIGGTSTFFSSTLSFVSSQPFFQQHRLVASRLWRLVYALGLMIGAAIYFAASGEAWVTQVSHGQLLLGGLLIGFGARLAKGCTAGHGICGLASLQLPSVLAVITFLLTAIAVAQLVQFIGVG
jgi:hypothetical protein